MFEFFSNRKLSIQEIDTYYSEVETRCATIRTYFFGIVNSKNKIFDENFFESNLNMISKNIDSLYPFIVSNKNLLDKISSSFRNLLILKETIRNRYAKLSTEKNLQDAVNNFNRDVETFKGICVDLSNRFEELKLKEKSYLQNQKDTLLQNQKKAA